MKKITLIVVALFASFSVMLAQDAQPCPCELENDLDALYAVAMERNSLYHGNLYNDGDGPVWAIIAELGLKGYQQAPSASYYLKVTDTQGDYAYIQMSSCQMCLEVTYDLLQQRGIREVRIIAESSSLHGSCRNKSYTPSDLQDVKNRRDGNWNGLKDDVGW